MKFRQERIFEGNIANNTSNFDIGFNTPKNGIFRQLITQYFQNISIDKFNINVDKISENLKEYLGYYPGVEVIWDTAYKLNEKAEVSDKIENLEKIVILFFNEDNNLERFEYIHQ
jgi:hypothetical protein